MEKLIGECMLCKRDMKVSNTTFGKGCERNIYEILNIPYSREIKDKEELHILWKKTGAIGLNREQQQILVNRYLANVYLEQIPYGNIEKYKKQLNEDILVLKYGENLKLKTVNKISLNEIYYIYKKTKKFTASLDKLSKMNWKEEATEKFIIANFSFIFHLTENSSQFQKNIYKGMQFAFWQVVIEVGGRYAEYKTSAYLLQNSLKKYPKNLNITNGPIIDEIKQDNNFMIYINKLLSQHKNEKNFYVDKDNNEETNKFSFSTGDLYFGIHGLETFKVSGEKDSDNKRILKIEMKDTYDYTNPKKLDEYYNDTENVPKSLLSSTLYNMASKSVKDGVIKPFIIYLFFDLNEDEVKQFE